MAIGAPDQQIGTGLMQDVIQLGPVVTGGGMAGGLRSPART